MSQGPPVAQKPAAVSDEDFDLLRGVVLSDQLSLESQASIFFSYARESAKLSGILTDVGEHKGAKFTVFVPTNKAVMSLTRKPHEAHGTSAEDSIEITDEEAELQSQENLERWVSAHIVPGYLELTRASEGTHKTLLDGTSVVLTLKDSSASPEMSQWRVNSEIPILSTRQASNGVMYLIDGTIEV